MYGLNNIYIYISIPPILCQSKLVYFTVCTRQVTISIVYYANDKRQPVDFIIPCSCSCCRLRDWRTNGLVTRWCGWWRPQERDKCRTQLARCLQCYKIAHTTCAPVLGLKVKCRWCCCSCCCYCLATTQFIALRDWVANTHTHSRTHTQTDAHTRAQRETQFMPFSQS